MRTRHSDLEQTNKRTNKQANKKTLIGEIIMASQEGEEDEETHKPPFVFEVAWEVANKVGGIYTVLRSKAGVTTEELGDDYFMLGPYNHEQCQAEVSHTAPLSDTLPPTTC